MPNFLREIVAEVQGLLREGYYDVGGRVRVRNREPKSLQNAIQGARGHAVIAEFKPASPTNGQLASNLNIGKYIRSVESAGVVGFSILTQPGHFQGSLNNLEDAGERTSLPLLMKDFVISSQQIEAAAKLGADAVLFIQGIFDSGLALADEEDLISLAHNLGLEVLNEVNTADELTRAADSQSDMIGINHRDLKTLELDMNISEKLLQDPALKSSVKVVESGINGPEDARRYFQLGADAILVGTYLMQAEDASIAARSLVTMNV